MYGNATGRTTTLGMVGRRALRQLNQSSLQNPSFILLPGHSLPLASSGIFVIPHLTQPCNDAPLCLFFCWYAKGCL